MPGNSTVRLQDLLKKQGKVSVQRYFEISLFSMLGVSFLTVAFTGKLDLISILLVFLALLVKFWGYIRDRDIRLDPRTVTRLSIFYILFYFFDLVFLSPGEVIDQVLNATVHLILFTAVIKIFSASSYRDYIYLAVLAFLQMLAGAILMVDTVYFVWFVLYLLLAISTFLSYEIKRSTEAAVRPPEGPFREALRNRSALERSLLGLTVSTAAGMLLLAAVLFFAIPRYSTGYMSQLSLQPQNITGFSETVNLGDIGRILQSNVVVMRVIIEGEPQDVVGVRWRGIALTSFDGKTWYKDNTDRRIVQPASYERFVLPRWPGWEARPRRELRYRILRAAISNDTLFTAAVPREIRGPFRRLALDQTDSLHKPNYVPTPMGYEAVSNLGRPTPAELRSALDDYPAGIRLTYLQLPDLDPRVGELAAQLTADFDNNYDRAGALERYLHDSFRYTLDPQGIDPENPIASFLFEAKSGYCEFFAAAMTLMLRTQAIPARLVNGFQTGSFNPIGGDFIVRARDAHSWVEVYFPRYGWISFDPTPPDPNPVVESVFDNYKDAVELFWQEWVINYNSTRQASLAREVGRTSVDYSRRIRRFFRSTRQRGVALAERGELWIVDHKLLVSFLMILGFVVLMGYDKLANWRELRFLISWRFLPRSRGLEPQEATLTYARLMSLLGRKGYKRIPSQTPVEFARSFPTSALREPVSDFTNLYNALRFGSAPISVSRFRELLGKIRSAVTSGSKPPGK